MELLRLKGKNIVVTGASRGIGAGIAERLAAEGARIAITYTSKPEAAEAVREKLRLFGDQHIVVKMDVADEASVHAGFEQIHQHFSTIDGLVNNAGITRDQLLLRMKTEDFDQVMQTNLRGTFLCTKAVMRGMLKQRAGSIVNITSIIGHTGNLGQANYAASKAGTEAFAKSAALEVASRGIRINCVAPGFIATEMTGQLTEEQQKAIIDKVPLQTMGMPEDVAAAVAFLLSDDARYITGHTISVNGGMLM